jgi:iron complex transport system ATP-binding protein
MVLLRRGRVVADGAPDIVLTQALLSEHYEASVDVLSHDGGLAVVPRRVRSE